ncbi:MAG: DUF2262 domain-containing protein [Planctomycetaceae bacterium]|nr:DUF2262 domain-containing protein [Planctomycetaceae bacterium]
MSDETELPKTLKSEALGIFKRGDGDTYRKTFKWLKSKVDLDIDLEEPDLKQLQAAIRLLEALCEKTEYWQRRYNKYLVTEVLEVKNEGWLEDDENPVTADEFLQRMILVSISVFSESEFQFTFYDEEMFGSHFVDLTGTRKEGFTDFDIA